MDKGGYRLEHSSCSSSDHFKTLSGWESGNNTACSPELQSHNCLFSSCFKNARVEIAFLIRIKEGVRQPGLECEAFAMSAADAICAECGEELILALDCGAI